MDGESKITGIEQSEIPLESVPSEKRKKKPKRKGNFYIYRVKYDSGEIALATVDETGKKSRAIPQYHFCENQFAMERFVDKLNRKQRKSLKIKYLMTEPRNFATYLTVRKEDKEGVAEALTQLIASCGEGVQEQRGVLQLFLSILRGYSSHKVCKAVSRDTSPEWSRAPVVTVSYDPNAAEILRKLVQMISAQGKERQVIFPLCNGSETLDYSVLLKTKHRQRTRSKICLPSPFRNCSVFIDSRFFSKGKVFAFQARHPWCSVILLGASARNCVVAPIGVDGKIFAQCNCDWQETKIRAAVCCYQNYVLNMPKSSIREMTTVMEGIVLNYNQRRKKPLASIESEHIIRQLITLWLLLTSLRRDSFISEDECLGLFYQWRNLLLEDFVYLSQTRPDANPEREGLEIPSTSDELVARFEQKIQMMLREENSSRFLYVPPEGAYSAPTSLEDKSTHWGYLTTHKPNNQEDLAFKALVFRKQTLKQLFEREKISRSDFADMLKALNKKTVPYLSDCNKKRLPYGEKNDNAIVVLLDLEKMDFLDAETKARLKQKFEP